MDFVKVFATKNLEKPEIHYEIRIIFDNIRTNYMFDLDKLNAQKMLSLIDDYKKSNEDYVGKVSDFIKIKNNELILRMYKNEYGSQYTVISSRPNILRLLEIIETQIIESNVHYSKFDDQGKLIIRQDFITLGSDISHNIIRGGNKYYEYVVHDLVTTDQIGAYQADNKIIVYANHPHNETIKILFITTYDKFTLTKFRSFIESASVKNSNISISDFEYYHHNNYKHLIFKINGSHQFTKEYIRLSDLISLHIYSNAEPSYCKDGTYVRITNPNIINTLKKCILTFNVL